MGKQSRTVDMKDFDDFKEEIKAMLEHQNERMEVLIWQVTGHEKLGIEGLKPALKRLEDDFKISTARMEENFNKSISRIEKDVHGLTVWRSEMWKLDLKKLFTWEIVKKASALIISIGGGAYILFESLRHFGLVQTIKEFLK